MGLKKNQQNLQTKCHIYQYQAGTDFHHKPYPNILFMVTLSCGECYFFDSIEPCSDADSDAEIGQSSRDVHTSKSSTKGRNLFRSGHVKNMEDNQHKKITIL